MTSAFESCPYYILVVFTSLWREYKKTGKLRSESVFFVPYFICTHWGIFLDFRNVLCLNSVYIWLVVLVHTLNWTTSPNFFSWLCSRRRKLLMKKCSSTCDWELWRFLVRFNMQYSLQARAVKSLVPKYWCYLGRFWNLMNVFS